MLSMHVHICSYAGKGTIRLDEANYIPANQSHKYIVVEKSEYHISDSKITMIVFHTVQVCGWKDHPALTILLGIISIH